ncbi:hypothetical protein AB0B25_30220, partial [Nocardia sp. NPDC049190]|uniref:hypothetical protein n=1 Tax=Nocardia sp. NPDC049190 TaxID=3155650 RepID=UPI0033DF1321
TVHSDWGLLLGATVTGSAMPSVGAMIRTRWATIHTTPRMVAVAYSLESSLDEILFVAGPAVIGILTTIAWPAGILTVLGTTLTGMLWLAAQPSSQTAVANTGSRPLRAITQPGMPILCAITFAIGGILGATDMIIVARAPTPVLGTLVLALWAATSSAGALAYAAWSPTVTYQRLVIGTSTILATTTLLLLPTSFIQTACILTVGGIAFAPTIAILTGLTEQTCPRQSLTEAFAWLSSGTASGAAIGTITAGHILTTTEGRTPFTLPVLFAGLAATMSIAGHLSRARNTSQTPTADKTLTCQD